MVIRDSEYPDAPSCILKFEATGIYMRSVTARAGYTFTTIPAGL
jgi:hypothetical protein